MKAVACKHRLGKVVLPNRSAAGDNHQIGLRKGGPGKLFQFGQAVSADRLPHDLRPGLFRHRSEEHTSELQSLMRISYAVFCLKKTSRDSIDTTDPPAT